MNNGVLTLKNKIGKVTSDLGAYPWSGVIFFVIWTIIN